LFVAGINDLNGRRGTAIKIIGMKSSKTRVEICVYSSGIVGDKSFVKHIKLMVNNNKLYEEINCRSEMKKVYDPKEIIKVVSGHYEISGVGKFL
jgi:hypothetical protein